MTQAPEPDPDHPHPGPAPERSAPDAAGRLLSALLAAAGMTERPAAEPVLVETAG
jgi:hypothetical protein